VELDVIEPLVERVEGLGADAKARARHVEPVEARETRRGGQREEPPVGHVGVGDAERPEGREPFTRGDERDAFVAERDAGSDPMQLGGAKSARTRTSRPSPVTSTHYRSATRLRNFEALEYARALRAGDRQSHREYPLSQPASKAAQASNAAITAETEGDANE